MKQILYTSCPYSIDYSQGGFQIYSYTKGIEPSVLKLSVELFGGYPVSKEFYDSEDDLPPIYSFIRIKNTYFFNYREYAYKEIMTGRPGNYISHTFIKNKNEGVSSIDLLSNPKHFIHNSQLGFLKNEKVLYMQEVSKSLVRNNITRDNLIEYFSSSENVFQTKLLLKAIFASSIDKIVFKGRSENIFKIISYSLSLLPSYLLDGISFTTLEKNSPDSSFYKIVGYEESNRSVDFIYLLNCSSYCVFDLVNNKCSDIKNIEVDKVFDKYINSLFKDNNLDFTVLDRVNELLNQFSYEETPELSILLNYINNVENVSITSNNVISSLKDVIAMNFIELVDNHFNKILDYLENNCSSSLLEEIINYDEFDFSSLNNFTIKRFEKLLFYPYFNEDSSLKRNSSTYTIEASNEIISLYLEKINKPCIYLINKFLLLLKEDNNTRIDILEKILFNNELVDENDFALKKDIYLYIIELVKNENDKNQDDYILSLYLKLDDQDKRIFFDLVKQNEIGKSIVDKINVSEEMTNIVSYLNNKKGFSKNYDFNESYIKIRDNISLSYAVDKLLKSDILIENKEVYLEDIRDVLLLTKHLEEISKITKFIYITSKLKDKEVIKSLFRSLLEIIDEEQFTLKEWNKFTYIFKHYPYLEDVVMSGEYQLLYFNYLLYVNPKKLSSTLNIFSFPYTYQIEDFYQTSLILLKKKRYNNYHNIYLFLIDRFKSNFLSSYLEMMNRKLIIKPHYYEFLFKDIINNSSYSSEIKNMLVIQVFFISSISKKMKEKLYNTYLKKYLVYDYVLTSL